MMTSKEPLRKPSSALVRSACLMSECITVMSYSVPLRNIVAILHEAGADPSHMVRMTWYIVDRVEYNARLKELGQAYREVRGRNFPAMTCVQVAALVEQRAKVEIEVTAVLPD